MNLSNNKYKRLIIKYLQGNATPVEQQQVEDYIAKSERNKQLFESYRGLLFLTQKKKVEYNTESAWERVMNRILANEKNAGSNSSVLSSHSKKYPFMRYAISGIAAAILLVFGLVNVIKDKDTSMKQYATGLSVSSVSTLPDGSSVVLNTNTALNFPEKFEKDIREVSIFGEAFFEVKPDPDKPFIIHASGLDIKVLGTSFNVQAYPGSDFVKVTVNTGRVLVYPSGKKEDLGKTLTAGEIATFSHKSGIILKGVNDDLNVLSWKTGVLTFKETRLTEVFNAFEAKYQKEFVVADSNILNQRLTARFENQPLDDALETLSLIFNIKFENKESYILVH